MDTLNKQPRYWIDQEQDLLLLCRGHEITSPDDLSLACLACLANDVVGSSLQSAELSALAIATPEEQRVHTSRHQTCPQVNGFVRAYPYIFVCARSSVLFKNRVVGWWEAGRSVGYSSPLATLKSRCWAIRSLRVAEFGC